MNTIIKTNARDLKVDLKLFMKISKVFSECKPKELRHKIIKPLVFVAYRK